jgi:phosphate-selective porin
MKQLYILSFFVIVFSITGNSQSSNDVLNVLVQHKLISQQDADSLRSEAAIKQQETDAKRKSFPLTSSKPFQLSGYTQLRYQFFDEPTKFDGFDIRRAYVDLKGTISPFWGYRLQFDFSNSPKLMDAYAELKYNDRVNVLFGQTVIPFSLENITSNAKTDFIDRSQIVDALVSRKNDFIGDQNGRDIGVQAAGVLLKLNGKSLVDYKIGVFNGSGINTGDKNKTKDVVARIVVHPFIGLDFGGSYYDGVGTFGTPADNLGRTRLGAELSYVLNNASLKAEYIKAKDAQIKREGYYVQAGYFVLPQTLQFLVRLDTYDPNISVSKNKLIWYEAGVNFSLTQNVRFQFNYTYKKEEGTSVKNNVTSAQLQIQF